MSEILSNIVVEQTSINFSPDNNNLNITPEAINLNVFTGAAPVAGGPNGAVQFSNGGVLEGSGDFVFDTSNYTVIANQLEVKSRANLGLPANVKITGGTNGYFLQTDGTGNLSWAAGGSGGGNGSPGGSDTQIQFNDGGLFGGAVGLTFNKTTNAVSMPGNLSVTGGIYGIIETSNQPNITGLGTIASLSAGFISLGGNLNANGTVAASAFNGDGQLITNINANNIVGNVSSANYAITAGTANTANTATTAGTVTTAAQPNITSVGTLTSLTATGNITGNVGKFTTANITGNLVSGNANLGNLARANFFQGDGGYLSNIIAANINGNLTRIVNGTSNVNIPTANGNITFSVNGVANVATISNTTVFTTRLRTSSDSIVLGNGAADPSNDINGIISIGENSGNANSSGGRISIGGKAGQGGNSGQYTIGIGAEAAQNATANGSVMIGYRAGRTATAENSVYIGQSAGINTGSGFWSVAIGYEAKANGGGAYSIGIGARAGSTSAGGVGAIAVGTNAGRQAQGPDTVALGSDAGYFNQGNSAVAIGKGAGYGNLTTGQQLNAIAIGSDSGRNYQGANSISIGASAGAINQGNSAIAIGNSAGFGTQGVDSIAIGRTAGTNGQSTKAIAIGAAAGSSVQGISAIAIGSQAGVAQGNFSIAIGANAGSGNTQANNSIVINASGTDLEGPTANALFVKPIRNAASANVLYYNPTSGEVTYNTAAFGSFSSNVTQASAGANTVNYITFNNTVDNNQVTVVSNSRLTVARTGRYNIQFSAVLTHNVNQLANVEIWLIKNGNAVPDTNTRLTVAKDQSTPAAWNFIDNATTANTYYQIAWASSDTSVQLVATPAANTIANVAIPSVIATVVPVGT